MAKVGVPKGNLGDIIMFAPIIVETAIKLYDKILILFGPKKSKPQDNQVKREITLVDLDKRIEQLESNEIQQAELIKDMARQVGNLSKAAQTISNRLFVVTILAIVAFFGFLVMAIKIWFF